MRGAPQPGFSRHILRIRSRVSRARTGRPGCPRRTFQVQNRRKPLRCQAKTVSGLTIASVECQPLQRRDRQTQSRRSTGVNFGRFFADLRSAPIWWRRATFSSSRSMRARKRTQSGEERCQKGEHRRMESGTKYNSCLFRHFEVFEKHRDCKSLQAMRDDGQPALLSS